MVEGRGGSVFPAYWDWDCLAEPIALKEADYGFRILVEEPGDERDKTQKFNIARHRVLRRSRKSLVSMAVALCGERGPAAPLRFARVSK